MTRTLLSLANLFLADKAGFRSSLSAPVLIWKTPPSESGIEHWQGTHGGSVGTRPTPGAALAFDVQKDPKKKNAFPMGITVGRIETNDVPLDDGSVSRFHAWIVHEKGKWILRDAESQNGTFCDGTRLLANQKFPIKDKAKLKFGDVEVSFLSVDSLISMMEQMIKA